MTTEPSSLQLIEDVENLHDKSRVFKDLLAGTAGGISQVLVGQPFDTTKVRLQTSTSPITAIEVIQKLIKNEGPRAFYKGTLTPLIGVGACVSLQFGVNEAMKRLFHRINGTNNTTLSLPQYYLCGLSGGFVNSFLASPIEHVRIRLQTQTGSGSAAEFCGPIDCIRKLKAEKSLMRGLTPTMVRESHGCGIYFLVYEALIAKQIRSGIERKDIPAWKLCLYGAISGTVLWFTIYPLDVIKSVMQTDNLVAPKSGKNIPQVVKTIMKEKGIGGFFKGFGPTILRAAPANAATFATFETMMRLLD